MSNQKINRLAAALALMQAVDFGDTPAYTMREKEPEISTSRYERREIKRRRKQAQKNRGKK